MADQFSENDVESLGEKLEHFNQTLTPGEQSALVEILERATPQEGDVQGYVMKSAVKAQSASSVKVLVMSAFKGIK